MEIRREDDDDVERGLVRRPGGTTGPGEAGGGVGGGRRRRSSAGGDPVWPTVDGPLGLTDGEEAVAYARSFFLWGFALLPLLWAVNCWYFWPVLRSPRSSSPPYFSRLRPYVLRSAIGFTIFAVLLTTWTLVFAIGGERLFGPVWNDLVAYNLADKLGLTGWM